MDTKKLEMDGGATATETSAEVKLEDVGDQAAGATGDTPETLKPEPKKDKSASDGNTEVTNGDENAGAAGNGTEMAAQNVELAKEENADAGLGNRYRDLGPVGRTLMAIVTKCNPAFLKYFCSESSSGEATDEDSSTEELDPLWPLIVDGYRLGFIVPKVLVQMRKYPHVFNFENNRVTLNSSLKDYESRSAAFALVLQDWRNRDVFSCLKGWRDECYEVRRDLSTVAVMRMERAGTCLFGIRQYGVDINGYVRHPTKGLCVWLQQRSMTKPTWPGRWDNMVGGGLAVGYSVYETAIKEAGEEASVPAHLLSNMHAVGHVMIFYESERGLHPNTEIVYDLELPLDFTPTNQDGEVDGFQLVSVQDMLELVMSPRFKTTSCPIALDFLVRHGAVSEELLGCHFEQFLDLMHVPLNTIYS